VKRAEGVGLPSTPGRLGDCTMEAIDGDWQAQWMVGVFLFGNGINIKAKAMMQNTR